MRSVLYTRNCIEQVILNIPAANVNKENNQQSSLPSSILREQRNRIEGNLDLSDVYIHNVRQIYITKIFRFSASTCQVNTYSFGVIWLLLVSYGRDN